MNLQRSIILASLLLASACAEGEVSQQQSGLCVVMGDAGLVCDDGGLGPDASGTDGGGVDSGLPTVDGGIQCLVVLDDGGMEECPDGGGGGVDGGGVVDGGGGGDGGMDGGTSDGGSGDAGIDGGGPPDASVPVDGGTCECPSTLPGSDSLGFTFGDDYEIPGDCPVFGGKFGASVSLGVKATNAAPACSIDKDGNASFASSISASASLSGADHLCKISHSFGINGDFSVGTDECADCNESTLLYEPNGQTCNKYSGNVGLDVAKTWHMNIRKNKSLRIPLLGKRISFGVKCGVDATLGLGVKVGGTGSLGSDDFECGSCESCVSGSASVSIDGTGEGKCGMWLLGVRKKPITFGCDNCFIAKVGATVGGKVATDGCGEDACFTVGGNLSGELPKVSKCFDFRWFHVAGKAGLTASISPTYNSCESGVKWNPVVDTLLQVNSGWGRCD